MEIIGEVDVAPENFNYHYFTFAGDGSYNGMVRDGSFCAYDTYGDTIYAGTYKNTDLDVPFTVRIKLSATPTTPPNIFGF